MFHSHRRIDLAAQFQQEGYTIIGLQETRLKKARAMPVQRPVPFSIHHALYWTELEEGAEPFESLSKVKLDSSIYEIKMQQPMQMV